MSNRNQNQQTQPLSQGISKYADIFFVVIVLSFVLFGVFIAVSISGKNDELIAAILLGITIGALLGAFIGGFFSYLLKGLSVIVAWYESTPPGCISIAHQDTGEAPVSKPRVPDVPVAHYEKPDAVSEDVIPTGYWKCLSCGAILPKYTTTCKRCGADKPAQPKPTSEHKPTPPKPIRQKTQHPADATTWLCTCGAENPVSRGTCDSCGAFKPRR